MGGRRAVALVTVGVAALLVSCGSSGGSAATGSTTTRRATTTTTTEPPGRLDPKAVDECAIVTTAELRKVVGAVGKPKRSKTDSARSCTWAVAKGGAQGKVQVFVRAEPTDVERFRTMVRENFEGSSCDVREVEIGATSFVESCPGQGTGMDVLARDVQLGLLLTGSTSEPEEKLQELARLAVARAATLS